MGFTDLLNVEFTAGGLVLYMFAGLFLLLPPIIWLLEDLTKPKPPAPKKTMGKLPAASKTLPIPPPTRIKEIRIYPVKSCRGISVTERKLLKTGLELDRAWMFVDAAEGKFLTIRQNSDMTLIDTELTEDDKLVIGIRDRKPTLKLTIDAHPTKDWFKTNCELRQVEIWGSSVDAWAYPHSLTKDFDAFFGREVRLVYKGPTPRVLQGKGAPEILGRDSAVNFADMMPVQVSNQKSMDELNSRLAKDGKGPWSIERFRPNIVVEGDEPWYEDTWKTVITGESERESTTLDVVYHCARCLVPNVDPDSAEKDKHQPWDTLMKYRRIDEGIKFKPCFGMLCVPREEGTIRVGMPFTITEVTSEHLYN